MCRFLVVLCLTVAHATAWAQSSGSTNQAQATATEAQRAVTQLAARQQALQVRYQEQTDAIARQMHQPRSWNRDRDVAAAKRDADDTARQLETATRELATATDRLTNARRAWLAAIDAELTVATGPRAGELKAMRARLAPQLKTPPRRIILPNANIDPNADPEDLDQQAAAIRDAEQQLSQEVAGLTNLAAEHTKNAELLKHHQRANEMDIRDDNSAHRVASHATTAGGTADLPTGSGAPPTDARTQPSSFEADVPIVLHDVVEQTTLDNLASASRSGDPSKRAAATLKTRDAVKARLDQLYQKRLAIENRARELRPKR